MNHPRKQCLKVREAQANLLREKSGHASMNAAPPVMLTTRIALQRLCAGTGCRVGIETLYCWIAARKINSVRVGRRIFIPVEALDNLVEKCLAGKRLYRMVDNPIENCLVGESLKTAPE